MKTMLRFAFAALLAATAPLATASADDGFTADQKALIDEQVRDYLLRNPEVIIEAMEVLERRREEQERSTDAAMISSLGDELKNDGYSFVAGNPEGDVTVVEFADYRCGYCKQAHEDVKALLAADPNVRLVIKEFPILGPDSTFAARAAMAAQKQGDAEYLALNDAMMTWRGELSEAAVIALADEAGLDMDRFRNDMEDPTIAENIQRTYALARQLQINGTPGFIVGGRIIRGYVPFDQLRELVEDARERG
ncbi:MAG: DsbA family protein [Pseudomonadota bacterium]